MLPASGIWFIALYTYNPGAWLMHCHIGCIRVGVALQLVRAWYSEIADFLIIDK